MMEMDLIGIAMPLYTFARAWETRRYLASGESNTFSATIASSR